MRRIQIKMMGTLRFAHPTMLFFQQKDEVGWAKADRPCPSIPRVDAEMMGTLHFAHPVLQKNKKMICKALIKDLPATIVE
jgi:hypothetical protein